MQRPYILHAFCMTNIKERLFIMPSNGFDQLNEIMRAYRETNVLFAAYELGILDNISSHSIEFDDLTRDLNLSEKGLGRLLSALCAMGIIIQKDNSYTIAARYGKFLDPESASYIGGLIKHEIHLQKRWMQLSESVKSGLPVKKLDEPVKPEDTGKTIDNKKPIPVVSDQADKQKKLRVSGIVQSNKTIADENNDTMGTEIDKIIENLEKQKRK